MKDAEKLLPDFDELMLISERLASAQAELIVAKNYQHELQATCIKAALLNEKFWIGGKRPAMNYCLNVIKYVGNTPEDKKVLQKISNKIAGISEDIELLKRLLESAKEKLDLYRTLCFSERQALL